MDIAELPESTLTPNAHTLGQMRMWRQGIDHGTKQLPRVSDSTVYTEAYERGVTLGRAERGEIVIAVAHACLCHKCLTMFVGGILTECGCAAGAVPERGILGVYGPHVATDPADFLSYKRIRELCRTGIRVVTDNGTDITAEFSMLQ